VRKQRFLSTIMKNRARQIGHWRDLGDITYPGVHFLSTIMEISDLSAPESRDRGEKVLLALSVA
jgi:hypothetical protein